MNYEVKDEVVLPFHTVPLQYAKFKNKLEPSFSFQDSQPHEWVPDERTCGGSSKAINHRRTVAHEEDSSSTPTKSGENMRKFNIQCKLKNINWLIGILRLKVKFNFMESWLDANGHAGG